jgi:23S rRNA (adenine2503-C2)-methyltransferase
MQTIKKYVSQDNTIKRLHRLDDGNIVESVIIPHKTKSNMCISTQVGCRMGCRFCKSGKRFVRNLSAEEILGQIDEPVGSVVLMGMGEPLDNPNTLKAVELIIKEKKIPSRCITVSTCGICDRMEALLPTKVNIAVSLNATTDDQRNVIMPINKQYPLTLLKETMDRINKLIPSKRRLEIEYVMIKGFNDTLQDARRLAELVPKKSLINLIPVNSDGPDFQPSDEGIIEEFKAAMRKQGFICLIRASRGKDVRAACGMLAGALDKSTQNI